MSDPKSVELYATERETDLLIEAAHPSRPDRYKLVHQHIERIKAAARREAEAEVANAFVAWGMKNETAAPPLDWKWFGEIARRYSPLHEEHNAEEAP